MKAAPDSALPAPILAYCVIHEKNATTPRDGYAATMQEFHARLRVETAKLRTDRLRLLSDAHARELNTLQGSLNEYLQTPLRADKEQIARAILLSFRKIHELSFPHEPPGVTASTEGELIPLPHGQPPLRKLGLNGSRYLGDLGFTPQQKGGAIFESVFLVKGGENLDVLEHLVRDVLGIYATTHGKHLGEFGHYRYALYNLVQVRGEDYSTAVSPFEAVFFFSKPGPETIKYAPFRTALASLMEEMGTAIGISDLSLWQRKLGLGAGVEFALRIPLPEEGRIDDVAEWLVRYSANAAVKRALGTDSRLILKKVLVRT